MVATVYLLLLWDLDSADWTSPITNHLDLLRLNILDVFACLYTWQPVSNLSGDSIKSLF